jgi:hypothetical protein
LALCVCFVDRCLSFCPFCFGHCVVCSSSIYGFWLPLGYCQTLLERLFWYSRVLLTCHTGDIINIEGFPRYQVLRCYIRNRLPNSMISIIIWSIVDLGTSRGLHVVKFKSTLNIICRWRWYLKNKYQYSSEIVKSVIPLQSKVKKKISTASNKTIYKMETFTHVKLQPMMKTVVSLYAGLLQNWHSDHIYKCINITKVNLNLKVYLKYIKTINISHNRYASSLTDTSHEIALLVQVIHRSIKTTWQTMIIKYPFCLLYKGSSKLWIQWPSLCPWKPMGTQVSYTNVAC